MPDGLRRRFLGGLLPCLTAVLLLGVIPVVFREPATTFYSTADIAIHAYQLSMANSVSSEDARFPFSSFQKLPEDLLFGTHSYFPYRFHTCRCPSTDVALARITGDVEHFHAGPVENRSGLTITALQTDNGLYLLFGESAGSWPQRLFAHLNGNG